MTGLPFAKLHGAGNDYVHLDGIRDGVTVELAAELAVPLSDRHFGVGADGVILTAASEVADVRMHMWNADGSRGAMCGNGLRQVARLAHDRGYAQGQSVSVETDAGIFEVELLFGVSGEPEAARVPMRGAWVAAEPSLLEVCGRRLAYHRGSVGNPHAVVFVDEDLDAVPVLQLGAALQTHAAFDGGVNVEFVRVLGPSLLAQRTFERGSGETLACGTGATVAALAAWATGRVATSELEVQLRGGTLGFARTADGVPVMTGRVAVVCSGVVHLPLARRGASS
ncbi:MAG: diaminopimelate epimerase [Planctomycetota bacterium]|nr:diaminopimelate epimerase [Planctomycetota bacterium]MDA0932732.1 diaminopimelate epimerase [Planctomycetota bacterium]MDA1222605.1 diaminopimelate epimerase [Planctomycetota bacterium]